MSSANAAANSVSACTYRISLNPDAPVGIMHVARYAQKRRGQSELRWTGVSANNVTSSVAAVCPQLLACCFYLSIIS